MPQVSHVTSSGFVFEKIESTVVIRCPRPLVPLAELEYLREVGPAGGRISEVRRTSGDGRELHLVTVEVPGRGAQTLTFDAGPAFLGYFRQATTVIMYVVYALAAVTALSTLAYLLVHFFAR